MEGGRSAGAARLARAIGIMGVGLVVGLSSAAALRVRRALLTARRSVAASRNPSERITRMLVVGDGAAVGAGADPEQSVPGRIARMFPMTAIDNHAQPGARFSDVVRQLDGTSRYDVILIIAGGSDVIRMTNSDKLRIAMRDAVWRARMRAPRVIIVPPGDMGAAPFFLPPVSTWLTRRARHAQSFARHAAHEFGAICVPFFREAAVDPLRRDPRRFYARDGLHYSADGYALMFVELLRAVPLGRFLRGRSSVTDRNLAEQLAERP